ncbi:MAG: hypothetical protein CMB99_05045 [Flavobacteriaceae bacterium]|nr:hypothetical protein [Flavobacteriaceae bacterium]|tara:strand:- start:90729 stop:91421 length:693 start_codon:yes stop_codon:yes gene_type:complete
MSRKTLLLPLFLVVTFFVQSQEILFVGNSLTYSNDLPKIVEEIAEEFEKNLNTEALCYPNYAIIDHLNEGKLQILLQNKRFDYLIVQQGPSSQGEGKKMLIEDGQKLKAICDQYNIRMAYFMVWTSKAWYQTMDQVIDNHRIAAKENKALLFPVGRVWKAFREKSPSINLYASDGFHPSSTGSFLAALTMFYQLYPETDLNQLDQKFYGQWMLSPKEYKLLAKTIRQESN